MFRWLFGLASFAATCLAAPAFAEDLAMLGPIAGLAGTLAVRALATGVQKLQSEEPPRESRCPTRRASSLR